MTPIVVMPLALTLCFAVDAVIESPEHNDGLWPIGASMVFVGALFAAAIVAAVAATQSSKPSGRHRGGAIDKLNLR